MPNLTHLPYNLAGEIYRSPMPFGAFDTGRTTLQEYHQHGIDLVLMLTGDKEDRKRSGRNLKALYEKEGFDVLHFPIEDFDVPDDVSGMDVVLKEVIAQAQSGKHIAIHCYAGLGRTGMFAALLARRILGLDGPKAVAWARQHIGAAVETKEQIMVVLQDKGN